MPAGFSASSCGPVTKPSKDIAMDTYTWDITVLLSSTRDIAVKMLRLAIRTYRSSANIMRFGRQCGAARLGPRPRPNS